MHKIIKMISKVKIFSGRRAIAALLTIPFIYTLASFLSCGPFNLGVFGSFVHYFSDAFIGAVYWNKLFQAAMVAFTYFLHAYFIILFVEFIVRNFRNKKIKILIAVIVIISFISCIYIYQLTSASYTKSISVVEKIKDEIEGDERFEKISFEILYSDTVKLIGVVRNQADYDYLKSIVVDKYGLDNYAMFSVEVDKFPNIGIPIRQSEKNSYRSVSVTYILTAKLEVRDGIIKLLDKNYIVNAIRFSEFLIDSQKICRVYVEENKEAQAIELINDNFKDAILYD